MITIDDDNGDDDCDDEDDDEYEKDCWLELDKEEQYTIWVIVQIFLMRAFR